MPTWRHTAPYGRLSAIGETVSSPVASLEFVCDNKGCGGDGELQFLVLGVRVRAIQVVSVSEVRQRRAHIVKPVDGWASLSTEDGYGIIEPTKRCSRYKVREYNTS